MTTRVRFGAWICSLTVVALLTLGGCSQTVSQRSVTLQTVLHDMSPNFESVALSHDQGVIRRARAVDINARQLHDDLTQFFLMNRPLRMSIYAIP